MLLQRPIAIFDIESTGLDRQNDRIIDISVVKIHDIERDWEVRTKRLNPGIPIPEASTKIHGITNEMVVGCPSFSMIAKSLQALFEGCDIGGYGCLAFDMPMLYNEFLRAGITWDYQAFNIIDCSNIFKQKEPRDLTAAVKFFCNETHDDAHGAEADAVATAKVLLHQLNRYPELNEMPFSELAIYSNYGKKILDLSGKFSYNEAGEIILNFGPHRGLPARAHLDFVEWMLQKDFPPDTRKICYQLFSENPSNADDDDDNFGF